MEVAGITPKETSEEDTVRWYEGGYESTSSIAGCTVVGK